MSSPLQGTAADLIKLAMVRIDREMERQGGQAAMLLQVHDELVFDLYLPEKEKVLRVVQDRMKHALPELRVPIEVETGIGANWLEAH